MALARSSGVVTRPSEERCTSQNVDWGTLTDRRLIGQKQLKMTNSLGKERNNLDRDQAFQIC